MSRLLVVPIQLGCCHEASRCRLCPPPPQSPTPELVQAMIDNYRRVRARRGVRLLVSFFGGPHPSNDLLEPCADLPVMVRVRPDLLSRDDASRLWEAGVRDIELDVLSFCDHALKSMRRTYPGKRVTTMCEALARGFV